MKIDITKLFNGILDKIDIHETYNFSDEDINNAGMLNLSEVKIDGYVDLEGDFIGLNLTVKGIMVLPCNITLKPVDYAFSIKIDEIIDENEDFLAQNKKFNQNTIDILPIIWENIVMEIPMRIVSDEALDIKLEGQGWKLISEDDNA